MFFGFFELLLFAIGAIVIQPYSKQNQVLTCSGSLQLDWVEINTYGGMFMSMHSLLLTLSAATIVRTFYLIPKQNGLIQHFEFSLSTKIRASFAERVKRASLLVPDATLLSIQEDN